MVQKSGDQHLGCIKPCKQWDQLPTSTGPLVHDFFHQQYQSNCSFNSTSYEKRHRLGTRNTSIWVNIVQEDLDFIPSTWTTTSLFPDTSATHNLPLIFPFRTNPNLFSNCESNKKNFQQKKIEFPHIPNLPFPQPQQLQVTRKKRSHKRRSKARPRHKRTSCQVPLPAMSWSKPQHKFGETESPSDEAWNSLSVLFTVYDFYDCWVFFTKKNVKF